MFESRGDSALVPRGQFPLGCEAKLRAIYPEIQTILSSSTKRLVIGSVFSPILETLGGWLDSQAIPFSHITSRSASEAVRSTRAFIQGKTQILLTPYGRLALGKGLFLPLDEIVVDRVIFMEPEALVPRLWREELLACLTPYHTPKRPKTLETLDVRCRDTIETCPFIESSLGSGYSMQFLEATLTTVRVIENSSSQ
jgi:hypothetical protein